MYVNFWLKVQRLIIRAPLSQERLLYIPACEVPDGIARVIYRGKNSSVRESFTALDLLARLVTHIPNKGEQLVRYYGYYSNKSRGMRKKTETDVEVSSLVESNISKKVFCRNWARLIQKIIIQIHYAALNAVVTGELYPLSKIWLSSRRY